MAELDVRTLNSKGKLTIKPSALGKGGEGAVHLVESHNLPDLPPADQLVVKIYFKPEEGNRREKVISMISSPPASNMFAWPLAITASNGKFNGYVMEKLDHNSKKEWSQLAHTKTRRETASDFNVMYAITACENYAVALEALHKAGHIQGDINESNVFAGADATVKIVDTDSAQIKSKDGRIFRCEVGKPEYTAAELIGKPLREQNRTESSDAFAFGVMIFQMLTGGGHPTDGIYSGQDDPPSVTSRIVQGLLPMLRDESQRQFKAVPQIAAEGIPSRIKKLLLSLLDKNPSNRAPLGTVVSVLKDTKENLIQCDVDKAHWFDKRDGICGWCSHVSKGLPDPWGEKKQQQSVLPPVSFSSQAKPTGAAPRAAVNRPVHSSGNGLTAVQQQFRQNAGLPANPRPNLPQSTPSGSGGYSTGLSPQARILAAQAAANNNLAANTAARSHSQRTVQQPQNIPKKIKGKMTVRYQDGSYGQRPPLGVLLRNNPKLWRQAIATEYPDVFKFWWPEDRALPKVLGIWLAPVFSSVILTFVYWFAGALLTAEENLKYAQIAVPLFLLGSLFSALVFLLWWILCWVARAKAKKRYGTLDRVRQENFAITALRGTAISVGYLFTPVVLILVAVIFLLNVMIRGDRR